MTLTKYFEKEYEQISEIYRNVQRNYGFISACPDRIVEGVCISGLIGVVCFRLLTSENVINFVPKLAVFAMAVFKILPSVGKISCRMSSIIYYRPMLVDTYNNMKEVNEYIEEQEKYIQKNGTYKKSTKTLQFISQLSINQVVWKYKKQAKVVLNRTTLVDDTVRNNVCFGLEINDKNDESIWNALKRAQLKTFIQSLPNGLDTIVGERGVKFAGGQRQRIAIARALYCKPEILILDEATAALDNETEMAVMESIDSLQEQITMIIVAHRLTTIKKCDVVYEIVDGQAIQRGANL